MNQDKIKEIKQKYPKGTRIMLNSMDDSHHPVPSGTLGTVETVDDIGTIHMKWDNGQSLGLIVGEDSFYVIESFQNQEKIREADDPKMPYAGILIWWLEKKCRQRKEPKR